MCCLAKESAANKMKQKKTTGLVSESVRLLLILRELILPLLNAAVGFTQRCDELSVALPQSEQLGLHARLTYGSIKIQR